MMYPNLVPKHLCKTPITLRIDQEGLTEYGEPLPVITFEGKCNFQDHALTVYTDQLKRVNVTGTALFPGDICPKLATISGGTAEVFGTKRRILQGTKARNPDGTVNYTEVLLQ